MDPATIEALNIPPPPWRPPLVEERPWLSRAAQDAERIARKHSDAFARYAEDWFAILERTKRRFSEFSGEASCNQEYACALQQRLDDEPKPIIAEGEALVLKHPSVAALNGPAPLAQSRSVWLPTRVDLGLDTEVAAESAMTLGVIPFVREHRPDPGHDRKGGQEQALEDERVIDVGRGRNTRDRHPVSIHRDIVLRASHGEVRRVGPRQITPAFGAYRA